MRALGVLLALLLAVTARASTEPQRPGDRVVAALSQNRVAITAGFEGLELLVFGAIARSDPFNGEEIGVVVTVVGPSRPVVVRRRSRVAGMWINTDSLTIAQAPSFYAVASTGPLQDILSMDSDLTHRISTRLAIFEARADAGVANPGAFTEALIRIRADEDLYQSLEGSVSLDRDTLFSTTISLPKNLVEGLYVTRVFLVRDGRVIDAFETDIDVQKAVLERWLYNMAHNQPVLYGLLALGLALFFGWGASAAFRYLRG